MILVRTDILQYHRRPCRLRHHHIRAAIALKIRHRQRSWLVQFQAVQLQFFRNVAPARIAAITQYANLTATRTFTDRHQIQPTVIVVIDRRDTPTLLPAKIR